MFGMPGKVNRREYKMMLHPGCFQGDARTQGKAVEGCWRAFAGMLEREGIDTAGKMSLGKAGKQRQVSFFDTTDHALRRDLGLVFRLRRRRDRKGPWDATLKFRSGDRILTGSHRFRCGNKVTGKHKLEEDIKAPYKSETASFVSLISRSATAEGALRNAPKDIGDCLKSFDRLGSFEFPDTDQPVHAVNGFEASEQVYEGAFVALSDKIKAECGFVIWTNSNGDPSYPAVAEFSFRYELKDGGKDAMAAKSAWRAFETLYGARSWVDPSSKTKTAFVYDDVANLSAAGIGLT